MEKFTISIDEERKEELLKLLAENGFENPDLREDESNMSLMTDFYELTMAQVNVCQEDPSGIEYYDGFFRKEPLEAGYGLVCGTDTMID